MAPCCGAYGAPQNRLRELDGVRAASILLVLAAHMLPLGPGAWEVNAMAGLAGMSLFFCLSGFLIVNLLSKDQRIAPFLIRRVTRIVPLAAVYAAVAIPLAGGGLMSFVATLGFFQNYDYDGVTELTSHFWSLCVEMQFYLAVALIAWLFGRRGLLALPLLGLAVTLLRADQGIAYSINTHARVDEILSGATLALLTPWLLRPEQASLRQVLRHSLFPALVLWLGSCRVDLMPLPLLRPWLAMWLVAACFVQPYRWVSAILSLRALAFVAGISYALYVIHPITMHGWLGEGERFELYMVKRPISFALTFGLAWLSTRTIERSFNEWGKRVSGRIGNGPKGGATRVQVS